MIASPAPRVSVVAIFFNEERFLHEAIESVLAQRFADWELILVDDGSTDGSTSIARAYADRHARIRYVEHHGHINRGMSASRNLGIHHASGEFIALIDADDVWSIDKLMEQVAILEAHPGLAMVCGAVRYWKSWQGGQDTIEPSGVSINRVVLPPEAACTLYPLGSHGAPCPSDLLMRRSAIELVGGFEERYVRAYQLYEDQAFLIKLYMAAPVYFSDRVWLNYRLREDSCVATVMRHGHFHEVRRFFLEWLQAYLERLPPPIRAEVQPALDRALAPYRARTPRAVMRRLGWRCTSLVRRLLSLRSRGQFAQYN